MVKKGSFAVAAFLALIVTSPLWGQTVFGVDTNMFKWPSSVSCLTDPGDAYAWIKLSFVAMALSVAITAGAWTLSGAIGTQKLWDFMKGSMWSLVEGAALLSIFSIAFVGLRQFGEDNIDTARAYSVITRNTLMLDFATVVFVSLGFSFFASASPQFRPFGEKIGVYISFQTAPMFRPIFDLLGMLIQILSVAVLEWFAHEFMLCFIKNQMLTIILPAGFFLRQFGLKAAGNALIGVAIALYFVYPFMLVQAGEIITKHFQNELGSLPAATYTAPWGCSSEQAICCLPSGVPANYDEKPYIANGDTSELDNRVSVRKVLDGPIYLSFNSASWAGTGASCVFTTNFARVAKPVIDFVLKLPLGGIALGLFAGGLGGAAFFTVMKFMNLNWLALVLGLPMTALALSFTYEMVYFSFIISFVLSIFIIFITLTVAKEIARWLGTEIDLSALEKLI